jgi:hypothetical protein
MEDEERFKVYLLWPQRTTVSGYGKVRINTKLHYHGHHIQNMTVSGCWNLKKNSESLFLAYK